MTVFDRLHAIADRAADLVNAEGFRLEPRAAAPNGRPGPDNAREPVEGRGIFDYRQKPSEDAPPRRGTRLSIEPKGYRPELSVSDAELAGLRPSQGDVVVLLDQPGEPTFEVVSARRDGHGRTVLILVAGK